MIITVDVPASASALNTLLAACQRVAAIDMRAHRLPPLYRSGVRYQREARVGELGERWQLPSQTYRAGVGDCEDLALWRACEVGGRAVVVRRGTIWHAIVICPDGRVEDPSRKLGM